MHADHVKALAAKDAEHDKELAAKDAKHVKALGAKAAELVALRRLLVQAKNDKELAVLNLELCKKNANENAASWIVCIADLIRAKAIT